MEHANGERRKDREGDANSDSNTDSKSMINVDPYHQRDSVVPSDSEIEVDLELGNRRRQYYPHRLSMEAVVNAGIDGPSSDPPNYPGNDTSPRQFKTGNISDINVPRNINDQENLTDINVQRPPRTRRRTTRRLSRTRSLTQDTIEWISDAEYSGTNNATVLPAYDSSPEHGSHGVVACALEDVASCDDWTRSKYFVHPRLRRLPPAHELFAEVTNTKRPSNDKKALDRKWRSGEACGKSLVEAFFSSIRLGEDHMVSQILHSGLLDANTPGVGVDEWTTPLLCAVQHHQRDIVVLLLKERARINDSGICPIVADDFLDSSSSPSRQTADLWYSTEHWSPSGSAMERTVRTPLQLAAMLGDLPMVKLLMETYSADDSLVAPDGQTALRLASRYGHADVVNYLPSRRGGGYLRWKHKHRKFVGRIKKSVKEIGSFGKAVFYTVPKWIVKCFYEMFRDSAKYFWKHKHEIIPRIVKLVKRIAVGVWKEILELPTTIRLFSVGCWNMLVSLVTKKIPAAARVIWNFSKKAASVLWSAISWIINRFASLLHTVFTAIITAFRNMTWVDIRNGFIDLVHAVFISFPKAVGHAIVETVRTVGKVLAATFGCLGECAWFLLKLVASAIWFLLKNVWKIIAAIGGTIGEAGREIRVFFNPKAK